MLCPAPIIELARRIGETGLGAVVALAADDVAAATDVAAWCRMTGHDLVETVVGPDSVPVYRIRRTH